MSHSVCRSIHTATSAVSPAIVNQALKVRRFAYFDQLTDYLAKNFVLHSPGKFLIIPKPLGVSCVGERQKDGGIFKDGVHNKKDDEEKIDGRKERMVSLSDCIPHLSRIFREPKLQFNLGLKRYLSGAVVLPANDDEASKMQNSVKFSSLQNMEESNHYRCLALLLGTPTEKSGSITGYATFQPVGKHSEYIFVPGKAKRRAKAGKFAVEGTMHYNVIAEAHGCSLVEFSVNKFARHLPRLMFSHLLCPIMGDNLYLNRMTEIDGNKALLLPNQLKKSVRTWFPSELETRLQMSSSDIRLQWPMYCHVYQTIFPRYGWNLSVKKSEQDDVVDLVASIPPPPHFTSMLKVLNMHEQFMDFFKDEDVQSEVGNSLS